MAKRKNTFKAYAAVTVADLQNKMQEISAEIDGIIAAFDDAGTDIDAEGVKKIRALKDKRDKIAEQIDVRNASTGTTRPTTPREAPSREPGTGRDTVPATARNARNEGTFGFASFGEFAITCRQSAAGNSEALSRLTNVATTYGNEGTGADGGYAVPPDFRSTIWKKVMGEDSLLSRAEPFVTSGNSITFPADETTPWQTTGGILCFWESEGGVITPSKPALQLKNLRLVKLTALVPVSEELLEDAPGIESYLRIKAPEKMVAKINTAVLRGTGVGQPLGILNHASLVTVAAEASQDVNTINYANLTKMWSRMYAPSRRNAIWIINQDIEPQLLNLAFREDASSPVPAYMPAGGLSASPYGTLFGRPVVPVMAASTLGTVGDIILADMSQYMALTKGQQIRTDVSMHLYFDQAVTAFRFIFRLNGTPLWGSAITPENGTTTLSPFVALETRP